MTVARYAPWLLAFLVIPACGDRAEESHGVDGNGKGGSGPGNGGANNGGSGLVLPPPSGSSGTGGTVPAGPCTGLRCNQTTCTEGSCTQEPCAAGESTRVTGRVYDPAGKVPLYNVIVYVPNEPVPPFTEGAGCDRCGQGIMNPVTSTLTNTAGDFALPDAPVGENVPL